MHLRRSLLLFASCLLGAACTPEMVHQPVDDTSLGLEDAAADAPGLDQAAEHDAPDMDDVAPADAPADDLSAPVDATDIETSAHDAAPKVDAPVVDVTQDVLGTEAGTDKDVVLMTDTGPPSPAELSVSSAEVALQSGDAWLFPPEVVGGASPLVTFLLSNPGGFPLELTFDGQLQGPDASQFTLLVGPKSPIAAGDQGTLALSYTPTQAGVHQALVTIEHDGLGESPFTLHFEGSASDPSPPQKLFVAIAGCCTRWLSVDGWTWSKVQVDPQDSPLPLTQVVYGADRFVAAGGLSETQQSRYVHSKLGLALQKDDLQPGGPRFNLLQGVEYLVSGGAFGDIMVSHNDGASWQVAPGLEQLSSKDEFRNGTSGQGIVVLSASHCPQEGTLQTTLASSADGVSWAIDLVEGRCLEQLAFGNARFVSFGTSGSGSQPGSQHCSLSVDLKQWQDCGNLHEKWNSASDPGPLLFLNGEFVALGGMRSTDGLNWETLSWAGPTPEILLWDGAKYVGFAYLEDDDQGCVSVSGPTLESLVTVSLGASKAECPVDVAQGWAPASFDPSALPLLPTLQFHDLNGALGAGAPLNFGAVPVGDFALRELQLTNIGEGPLALALPDALALEGGSAVHFSWVALPTTPLGPGESTSLTLMYHPTAYGPHEAALNVQIGDPLATTSQLPLSGEGVVATDDLPRFVALGGCCERWWSNDGVHWQQTQAPSAAAATIRDLKYLEGLFVAVGGGEGGSRWMVSEDGVQWLVGDAETAGPWMGGVAALQGLLVAAGEGGAGRFSFDGASWKPATTDTSLHRRSVVRLGGAVVALGDGSDDGAVATLTTDGLSWASVSLGFNLNELAVGNGVLVGTGTSFPFDVATSLDGLQWDSVSAFSTEVLLENLGFHNGEFWLRSPSGIYRSADGIDWDFAPLWVPRHLVFAHGLWVGADSGSFYVGTEIGHLLPVSGPTPNVDHVVAGFRPAPADPWWLCDSDNPQIIPGQPEVCDGDGIDENCDGQVNEPGAVGCASYLKDADEDGAGVDGDVQCLCAPAAPYTATVDEGGDCDDADPARSPWLPEVCGAGQKDENCDGVVDEEGSQGCEPYFQDGDGDGFGVQDASKCLCAPFPPFVVSGGPTGDCDDANGAIFPGQKEVCDALMTDEDCDEVANEPGAQGCTMYLRDTDGDGFGVAADVKCLCAPEAPYTVLPGGLDDCDDSDVAVFPFQTELCDDGQTDENCDGVIDEEDAQGCTPYARDQDADGFGLPQDTRCSCALIPPYTASPAAPQDCDDAAPSVFPGQVESCDGVDNNCADGVDETFTTLGDSCVPGGAGPCTQSVVVCAPSAQATQCAPDPFPSPPGTPCDDASACTASDQCDGKLSPACMGLPVSCDDGNACTQDACLVATGCQFVPNASACNDDDPTTIFDTCAEGQCVGTPAACLSDQACDDGDVCNGLETCDMALGCQPGSPLACDDGAFCNGAESCDPVAGCQAGPPLVCDDGDVCNGLESCADLVGCLAGSPLGCDDGALCNGAESCHSQEGCLAGAPLACDDGDACNGAESCDDGAGCLAGVTPACDDGDACNGAETCHPQQGCLAGAALACDDSNACNGLESCDSASGCAPGTPLVCDDANLCNGAEFCTPAVGCQAGQALACDDANLCNGLEACEPLTGCVLGEALACDDGAPCNGLEICVPALGCQAGAPLTCDDGNPCNGAEGCGAEGCTSGSPLACDDADPCNGAETCDFLSGCQAGTPLVCSDADACNGQESCVVSQGCVAGTPLVCDDGDVCNGLETCEGSQGCLAGPPLMCDDGDPCTGIEQCGPLVGCFPGVGNFQGPLECDDLLACNGVEVCDPSLCLGFDECGPLQVCVAGEPPVCDDGDLCTGTEGCDDAAGCTPGVAVECGDDGDVCNGQLACDPADGTCVLGAAPACDDGLPCNGQESCDPQAGCQPASPLGCDDGDPCNGQEGCDDAVGCTPGAPLACDDGNACTSDACEAGQGCVHTSTNAPCDDGDACTLADTCTAGTCAGALDCLDTTCAWASDATCPALWAWTPGGMSPADGKVFPEVQNTTMVKGEESGSLSVQVVHHSDPSLGVFHEAATLLNPSGDLLLVKSDATESTSVFFHTATASGPEGPLGCVRSLDLKIAQDLQTGGCYAAVAPGLPKLRLSALGTQGEVLAMTSVDTLSPGCRLSLSLGDALQCATLAGYLVEFEQHPTPVQLSVGIRAVTFSLQTD